MKDSNMKARLAQKLAELELTPPMDKPYVLPERYAYEAICSLKFSAAFKDIASSLTDDWRNFSMSVGAGYESVDLQDAEAVADYIEFALWTEYYEAVAMKVRTLYEDLKAIERLYQEDRKPTSEAYRQCEAELRSRPQAK